jgi:hypothetical protein
MSFRAAKAREANADRLQSLVNRWHDLAWSQPVNAASDRIGWAEHLKRVAAEGAVKEAEQGA